MTGCWLVFVSWWGAPEVLAFLEEREARRVARGRALALAFAAGGSAVERGDGSWEDGGREWRVWVEAHAGACRP